MLKKLSLPFFVCLLLSDCASKKETIYEVDQFFDLDSFEQKVNLKSSKLDLGLVLGPVSLFFNDSLLYIESGGVDEIVGVYDANNGHKKLGHIIPYGQGPDESLSVNKMIFSGGKFWVHDIVATLVKKYELRLVGDSIKAVGVETIGFEIPSVTEMIVLNNEKIITSTHDVNPLTLFYEYNMKGDRIGTTATYPEYGEEIPKTAIVEVFRGHLLAHPKGDRFLMAYEYTDLIEFYDANAKLKKRLQGPHQFVPDFDLRMRGGHPFMQRIFDRTQWAYISASTDGDTIMMLYAGGKKRKKGEGEAGIHYRYVIAMDWKGKPLTYYELDHPIAHMAVDFKRRVIYGLDRVDSEVYTFNF